MITTEDFVISDMTIEWSESIPTEFAVVMNKPMLHKIVTTSVRLLGFPEGARRRDIYSRAHELMLVPMSGLVAARFMRRVQMSMSAKLYVTHGPRAMIGEALWVFGHVIDWQEGFRCEPDYATRYQHLPPDALLAFERL